MHAQRFDIGHVKSVLHAQPFFVVVFLVAGDRGTCCRHSLFDIGHVRSVLHAQHHLSPAREVRVARTTRTSRAEYQRLCMRVHEVRVVRAAVISGM